MGFLEILGGIVAGAGTFAFILGLFLAKASRENGKATRDLIAKLDEKAHERHQEVIELTRETQRLIEEGRRETRELIMYITNLISAEGEKTREIIKSKISSL